MGEPVPPSDVALNESECVFEDRMGEPVPPEPGTGALLKFAFAIWIAP